MHYLRFILFLILISSTSEFAYAQETASDRYANKFQHILDQHNLLGTILIFDVSQDSFYSNDFQRAAQGFSPASTFKIPNTIIALETEIVTNENTVLTWDGKKRSLPQWEKDLTLKDAFQLSCVPCYQEIAGKIGLARMQKYLTQFSYPGMQVNQDNLQHFWLVGASKISAFQQIQFLRNFYNRKITVTDHTYDTMLKIFEIEKGSDYSWNGKTGFFTFPKPTGWFVGFLHQGERMYYVAANMSPKEPDDVEKFLPARQQVVREALQVMGAF